MIIQILIMIVATLGAKNLFSLYEQHRGRLLQNKDDFLREKSIDITFKKGVLKIESTEKYLRNEPISIYNTTTLYKIYHDLIELISVGIKEKLKTKEEMKLEKHGFTSATNYSYDLEEENVELLNIINHYKENYPCNLFIPNELLDTNKLGNITLNYSATTKENIASNGNLEFRFIDPENYKKLVPAEALKDLDNFELDDNDKTIRCDNLKIDLKESYGQIRQYLGSSNYGAGFLKDTADRRMNDVNTTGFTIIHDSDYYEIFHNNNIDHDKSPILRLKTNLQKKLLILDKNSNINEKLSFNEYVEHAKNPNKDIDVLILHPVNKGYLVVTGW